MIGVIFNGIRTPLVSDGTISGLVGSRIFRDLAPEGTAAVMPYGVIQIAAGGDTNTSPRDALDVDITVRFTSGDALEAMNLADRARTVLHRTKPTLTDGWAAYDCQHETVVSYAETVKHTQYYHAGGSYRLRATKDS